MRALVRTLGILLIVFAAVLGTIKQTAVKPLPPPVVFVPTAKPAPPPNKSRHHTEPTEPKTATAPAPTSPPSHPAPAVVEAPQHPPVSKAVLTVATPEQYRFIVDLHKEDGWFDTKIPVTADLGVFEFCMGTVAGAEPCGPMIEAMIGGNVLKPNGMTANSQTIDLTTFLYGQNPDRSQHGQGAQFLQMPLQAVQTLKLRIVGANAPEELRNVMVKVHIGPNNQNPSQFTASQQLELAQLAKWVNQ